MKALCTHTFYSSGSPETGAMLYEEGKTYELSNNVMTLLKNNECLSAFKLEEAKPKKKETEKNEPELH